MKELGIITKQVEVIKKDIAGFQEAIRKLELLIHESQRRLDRIERGEDSAHVDVKT